MRNLFEIEMCKLKADYSNLSIVIEKSIKITKCNKVNLISYFIHLHYIHFLLLHEQANNLLKLFSYDKCNNIYNNIPKLGEIILGKSNYLLLKLFNHGIKTIGRLPALRITSKLHFLFLLRTG